MITIEKLLQKKERKEIIVMLSAYDYPVAKIIEKAGLDMILVGDSGGMVKLGYTNTIPVTMEEMLMMVKAVRRGAPNTFIIADLPFMSYNISIQEAIFNSGRMIKEGGADAVKLEGGIRIIDKVKAIINAGIAVQGHIGLTPQNFTQLSGFKVQGKNYLAAKALIEDALALENAGIFSLILEAIPMNLAKFITEKIKIPTIGTGCGNVCDGQNLISSDVFGFFDNLKPKYAKQYINLNKIILDAINLYKEEVVSSKFPSEEYTYKVDNEAYIHELLLEYK